MAASSTAPGAGELSSALAPFLGDGAEAALLARELPVFLMRQGLSVEESRGVALVRAPVAALTPELSWRFVAEHLATQVSGAVAPLGRAARLLAGALEQLPEAAAGAAGAARAAGRELPRLDRLVRGLRALAGGERPGKALFRRDPAAYAAAMRRWELSQPVAKEEREGGFVVEALEEERLSLRLAGARGRGEGERAAGAEGAGSPATEGDGGAGAVGPAIVLELELPGALLSLARQRDRLDALLGRSAGGWFVIDAFGAAAAWPGLAALGAKRRGGVRPSR